MLQSQWPLTLFPIDKEKQTPLTKQLRLSIYAWNDTENSEVNVCGADYFRNLVVITSIFISVPTLFRFGNVK